MSGEEVASYGAPGALPSVGIPLLFAGEAEGTLLASEDYLTNSASPVDQPARYPLPGPRTVSRLWVRVIANTLSAACVVSVALGGVDTAITVSIPALTAGDFSDLVNTQDFADGDGLDIHVAIPSGTLGQSVIMTVSVLC